MRKSFWLAGMLLIVPAAHADRIARMSPAERCAYTAQLKVAAYQVFEQGKPREAVRVDWRGDETHSEIDFVTHALDQAYAWLASWQQSSNEMLPLPSFRDMVFQACMGENDS